jgi:calcium-dependent protein kinase
MQQAAITFIVS